MTKTPKGQVAFTVTVPAEDHQALSERAAANDRTLTAETRRAIRDYLTNVKGRE